MDACVRGCCGLPPPLFLIRTIIIVWQSAKEKIEELENRSNDEGTLLQFNTGDYNKFLTGSNRDYGTFVLFTASDPKFNCQQCKYVRQGLTNACALPRVPPDVVHTSMYVWRKAASWAMTSGRSSPASRSLLLNRRAQMCDLLELWMVVWFMVCVVPHLLNHGDLAQCRPAYDELKVAADSFRRAKGSDDHFYFAVFDFGPATQKVFQKVRKRS